MTIAVMSWWRNSAARVGAYAERIAALRAHVGSKHDVRVIAVEGDSRDETRAELLKLPWSVVTCNHGGPPFRSTEDPDRMKALSKVINFGMHAVRPDDDVVLVVESDLLWTPHDVGSLIDIAYRRDEGFDIVAPMVWAGQTFYDVWAFRKDGVRFGPFPPYHVGLKKGLTEVDSVGSCLAMRGAVARAVRVKDGNALVGWCDAARASGYRIAVAPSFSVRHP